MIWQILEDILAGGHNSRVLFEGQESLLRSRLEFCEVVEFKKNQEQLAGLHTHLVKGEAKT